MKILQWMIYKWKDLKMLRLLLILCLVFAVAGCAIVQTAIGSLIGNVGADIIKEEKYFSSKEKPEEDNSPLKVISKDED
jgi:hypothetical protein